MLGLTVGIAGWVLTTSALASAGPQGPPSAVATPAPRLVLIRPDSKLFDRLFPRVNYKYRWELNAKSVNAGAVMMPKMTKMDIFRHWRFCIFLNHIGIASFFIVEITRYYKYHGAP